MIDWGQVLATLAGSLVMLVPVLLAVRWRVKRDQKRAKAEAELYEEGKPGYSTSPGAINYIHKDGRGNEYLRHIPPAVKLRRPWPTDDGLDVAAGVAVGFACGNVMGQAVSGACDDDQAAAPFEGGGGLSGGAGAASSWDDDAPAASSDASSSCGSDYSGAGGDCGVGE